MWKETRELCIETRELVFPSNHFLHITRRKIDIKNIQQKRPPTKPSLGGLGDTSRPEFDSFSFLFQNVIKYCEQNHQLDIRFRYMFPIQVCLLAIDSKPPSSLTPQFGSTGAGLLFIAPGTLDKSMASESKGRGED